MNTHTTHPTRIVIVGGGFGGIKTALELAGQSKAQITLVSNKDHFVYYPALYATATGGSHLQSIAPLADIFKHYPQVKVVLADMTGIDTTRKHIVLKSGDYIEYDFAVLALGVVTSYFGITGLAEHSYGIKSYKEVRTLKRHLHDEMTAEGKPDKNYIVVGAGPTGVELSAAMASYLERVKRNHGVSPRRKINVSLVEAAPRVLPRMSEIASRTVHKRLESLGVHVMVNKKVESQSSDSIHISGKDVPSKTVVWTSGVSNHPFYKEQADIFSFAPNGRVVVNAQLEAMPDVYVIGDNAATKYTGLAQTALHDALFVARVLKARLNNKPQPNYEAVSPPVVVPVGNHWAILEWRKIRLSGFVASFIRRLADAIGYNDVLPLGQAIGAWKAEYVHEEECSLCRAKTS